MAVRKVPAIFKTSDGDEFASEVDAVAHQKKVDALRKYHESRSHLANVLSRQMLTADGHKFDSGDYWQVVRSWGGMPQKIRLSCLGWYSQEFEMESDGSLALVIDGQSKDRRRVPIGDLYRSEKAATAAQVKAMREQIEVFTKQADELEATIPAMYS